MPERVICVAKPTRGAKSKDRCNIELRRTHLLPEMGLEWGHVSRVLWGHYAQPKEVPA